MSLERLIDGLARARVAFVVVGMVAGQIHGSRTATYDLDIVYDTQDDNVDRLAAYLLSIDAYVKDTWPNEGTASVFGRDILVAERSLTLGTAEGEVDVLDRIDGLGSYENVVRRSMTFDTGEGNAVRVLSLDGLIVAKRASDREKDRLHLFELEALSALRADVRTTDE